MSVNSDPASSRSEAVFDGFAWPLPRAFEAAIAQPRFEQGDVLYPDVRGYDRLEGRTPAGLVAIQVLQPPRSARARGGDGDGDRRLSAWDSEVTIERVDLASGASEIRALTQGKLFTAFWRGDESWLDPDREQPPVPRAARELQQMLPNAGEAFAERRFPSARRRGCRFLFVVDESSPSSRAKASAIEGALRAIGKVEELSLRPEAIGIDEADAFHPTLQIRGLFLPGRNEEEVHAALRSVLYAGSSERATETGAGEATGKTTDRFSLARHGLLESF